MAIRYPKKIICMSLIEEYNDWSVFSLGAIDIFVRTGSFLMLVLFLMFVGINYGDPSYHD